MNILESQNSGRILCIRLSGIGDIVHALPALSVLRAHRPSAHVAWITEQEVAGLLEGHPYIDQLITMPRGLWGRLLKNPLRWVEAAPQLARLARRLKGCKFDVSIDFHSSLKSALLVAAAAAPVRVGFAPPVARELSHLAQNRTVRAPGNGPHRVERNLALLGEIGIPTRFKSAVLPCGEQHAAVAQQVLKGLRRPLVIMHPGTSDFASFKRWPQERYAVLADRLMVERGAGVLVTWGPGERQLARRTVDGTTEGAKLAPALTHLQQLTCLLSRADLFIGSDTGPMHMASALSVPVVALFGPKDPEQTGPYGNRSEVVTAPVDCRPCSKRRCDDLRCMTRISVGQVYDAVCRLLDGGGGRRGRPGACNAAERGPARVSAVGPDVHLGRRTGP